jgi:Raf kinase inhibitor-like YbhB/YbcL family protein
MKFISSAFDDRAAIPRRFTCDGENLSPPLQWSGTPAGARSFVLLCDDPDAPAGTWHHWAAYDIPPTTTELADDAAQNTKMKQAVNDFRKVGYGGPCPPHGHGPHHYHFRPLPSRRTFFGQSPMRPALTLSERRASMRSRKRSSSVGMSDSAGRTPGPEDKERRR